MTFRIDNRYYPPLQETGQTGRITEHPETRKTPETQVGQTPFQEILDRELRKSGSDIKVSAHAGMRLTERNITLNERDLKALSEAVDKADAKGAKESLMLYKDIAFIASIRNRTLITAVDPRDSKENVFTNIDSAVIVK